MKYFLVNRVYKKQIVDFMKIVENFCKENKIPISLSSFLNYQVNPVIGIGPSYKFLGLCPKVLLADSKSFQHYYANLDLDFRRDVITKEEMQELYVRLIPNRSLVKFIRTILDKDALL